MGICEWLRAISVPVYLTIFVFAWSSWIDINGVFVELPLLVNTLPESWDLPSYIVIIIQVANIGPLVFVVASRLQPNKIREWPVIYLVIGIGLVSLLLLTFFWDATSMVGGADHSVGLLTLTALLALVDCTSSVVYLPYMAEFKPQYMTAFYIGEGLSGLIPSLVGLVQGVGSDPICVNVTGPNGTFQVWPEYTDPLFSVSEYFYVLFAMICLSGIAFTGLNFGHFCQKAKIRHSAENSLQDVDVSSSNPSFDSPKELPPADINLKPARDDDGKDPTADTIPPGQLVLFLVLCAWCNGMTNGVIPSTQTYTCLPYGNRAYNLSVRLSTLCNPLACFLAVFVASRSLAVLGTLTTLGTAITGYHLYLAAMSPAPPLQGDPWGEAIVILTSMLMIAFYSYVKVCVATTLVRSGGRRGLLWVGVVTQVGSLVGSVVTFVLVNKRLFTDMPACPA